MSGRATTGLDPRSWLLWGAAASLPSLVGRNPFPLAVSFLAVLTVRWTWTTWSDQGGRVASWHGIVRLALVFAAISVVFNVLTVSAGDRVLLDLSGDIPLVDLTITVNALVFGLLSAMAVITLVLVGTTVGAMVNWTSVMRLLPPRLTTFAVAGSVAIAFVPQMSVAFREIKEAQAIRGHRFRGVRDLIPIVVPMLTGGLERAVTMAEALESRGFGAAKGPTAAHHRLGSPLIALGLASTTLAGYLIAVGSARASGLAACIGFLALFVGWRLTASVGVRRTYLRPLVWSTSDWFASGGAALAIAAIGWTFATDPSSLRYEPYPTLTAPRINPFLILAQIVLLIPAFLVPVPEELR